MLHTDLPGPAERADKFVCPKEGGPPAFFRQSYDAEGLDINTDMLELAHQKCPGAALHHADLVEFDLGRRFAVVTCLFSSLPYVETVQRLMRAVENMSRHVEPGGLLIVEPWFSREQFDTGHAYATFVDRPQLKIARMHVGAVEDGVSVITFHYLVGTPSGIESFTETHRMGLFSHDDYLAAFRQNRLEAVYDPEGLTGRGLYVGILS
jgi:SAM-dependent methyltransferase